VFLTERQLHTGDTNYTDYKQWTCLQTPSEMPRFCQVTQPPATTTCPAGHCPRRHRPLDHCPRRHLATWPLPSEAPGLLATALGGTGHLPTVLGGTRPPGDCPRRHRPPGNCPHTHLATSGQTSVSWLLHWYRGLHWCRISVKPDAVPVANHGSTHYISFTLQPLTGSPRKGRSSLPSAL